ncbi:Protein ELYS [Zalerion maritima]|uniref:Protein ELYS n=1 Tax=Zalerion maritima TaxID=339359 RepID=A0AAD5RP65_9PEZI|nr:Protein ELYS [Zalerion maritima]
MAAFNYADYDQLFVLDLKFPYAANTVKEIEVSRRELGGILFIDRVLSQLNITKSKFYPPKSEDSLRTLHKNICKAPLSEHHKLSVFYYLLLDFDVANNHAALSDKFALDASVPAQYQIFMMGLWHMDRRDYASAVERLTHPSLTPEFADAIIVALTNQATESGDYSLPLAYYHTVKPTLKTSQGIECLFDAMARTSVVSALEFSRAYPDSAREQLFQRLIAAVLENPSGENPSERATELVSLPFDDSEEIWFQDYLACGDGKKLKKSADTLLMRKITTGKYTYVLGNKNVGGRWGAVLEGFRSGVGDRATS